MQWLPQIDALHLARGDWAGIRVETAGHEAIGTVEALGPGAERFTQVGDRVILDG